MNYDKVLEQIKPSKEEEEDIKALSDYIVQYFQTIIKDDVQIICGGSSAKGTFLKGDFDVDIFVRYKKTKENYSNELHKAVKEFCAHQKINYERVHGSRDYFKFTYKKISFEIVPVKYVTKVSEVQNVTDMSPMHVQWALSKLNSKLADDIRLAKRFCKAQRVYGAESYINGFSGHVIDILLINYGSFDKFIKEASNWGNKTIIDIKKIYQDASKELNKSKIQSPLIIVDPIDSNRNASASLSKEKYLFFIQKAREFLKNPSEKYFKIPKYVKPKEKEGQKLFVIDITPLKGKSDIIGSKILKGINYILKEMKNNQFQITSWDWFFNPHLTHFYFYVKDETLSKTYIRKGPGIDNKEGIKNFKQKHKTAFEKDGFLYVELEREFRTPKKLLDYLVKQEYFTSRLDSFNFN